MYQWFERVGYSVDTAALRRHYPEVGWHSYEAWAKEQDWKAILGGLWAVTEKSVGTIRTRITQKNTD